MSDEKRVLAIAVPTISSPFTKALIENDLLPANCRRYVIDSGPPEGVMKIYFDCFLDDRIFDPPVIKALSDLKALSDDDSPWGRTERAYAAYWRKTTGLTGEGWNDAWNMLNAEERSGWFAATAVLSV